MFIVVLLLHSIWAFLWVFLLLFPLHFRVFIHYFFPPWLVTHLTLEKRRETSYLYKTEVFTVPSVVYKP